MNRRARRISVAMALSAVVIGCARMRPPQPAPAASGHVDEQPLPISVYEIVPGPAPGAVSIARSPAGDPLAQLGATKRVTLTASNASARTLLLSLAREAGVNLVVSPDVDARVSVNFVDIPAADALRAIIVDAGLSILTAGLRAPWPPVVFFQLPVNVNSATAETIAARFGVSLEMAKWIVESRPTP